eukprot:518498-Rhodomonas_salina.2
MKCTEQGILTKRSPLLCTPPPTLSMAKDKAATKDKPKGAPAKPEGTPANANAQDYMCKC